MINRVFKNWQAGFFHPVVFWTRIKRFWPFFIWMGILLAASYFYFQEAKVGSFLGVVESPRELAAPLETARLTEVHVEPGANISQGRVLARFDTSLLDGELAMEWLEVERQFSTLVKEVEQELHQARLAYFQDRAELKALEEEIEHIKGLLERRLISAEELTNLRIRKKIVENAVLMHPETLEKLENELQNVRKKRDAALNWLGESAHISALETYDWDTLEESLDIDIEGHIEKIGLLLKRRSKYTLRARQNGIVSQVYHQVGDVVSGGTPVLSIIVEGPQRIIGFLSETRSHDLRIGSRVYLTTRTGNDNMQTAIVVALDPQINHFPEYVSPLPGRPVRGRKVIMHPENDARFLPGETVNIHITIPWWIRAKDYFWSLFSSAENTI